MAPPLRAVPDAAPREGIVHIELPGDLWADMDDDPDWGLLAAISGMADEGSAALAIPEVGAALVRLAKAWNLPAKSAGSYESEPASLAGDGKPAKAAIVVAWKAGDVVPISVAGIKTVSAKTIISLAGQYGMSFTQLPNM